MNYNLKYYIEENGKITRDHKFDTSEHALQLLLMADEIMEALEHTNDATDPKVNILVANFNYAISKLRILRKSGNPMDDTTIKDGELNDYKEELADIFIRWCSYVDQFDSAEIEKIIQDKMQVNRNRPVKHGKKF